jgi:hypothetical protein
MYSPGPAGRGTHLALSLLLAAVLAACGADASLEPTPLGARYTIEVAFQESFTVLLTDPAEAALAEALLASGEDMIVMGTLARGDGGFNRPYSWHLVPETTRFVDMTLEACSGRPASDVEADLDYWMERIGTFCPWGSRVVSRVD